MARSRLLLAALLFAGASLVACSEQDRDEADGGASEAASADATSPTDAIDPPDPAASDHLDSPRSIADQIEAADAVIVDPATEPEDLADAGLRHQVALRVLGRHPEWGRRVQRALPARLRPTVRDLAASRREFRSMHTTLSTTLPAWRIVAPEPAADLRSHYRAAEREFGVGWEYLAAINLVETGMGRIRGTSVAGAQGPMQFIPATWDAYGRGDINDPRDAIMAAARYLDARGFEAGDDAAIDGALYGYNNHNAYVRGVRLIAETLERRPRLYRGYHAWEVFYLTRRGDVLLPIGYDEREPVPVREYLRR